MAERTKLEMARAWAEIVIDRWRKRMEALDVGDTGALLKSFEAQVAADSNGDPAKITFAFLYYGRFPDMGVGRGVTLSDVPDASRKVKPWYSQTFMKEVLALGRMMAHKYGIDAAMAVSAFQNSIYDTAGIVKNDAAWHALQK